MLNRVLDERETSKESKTLSFSKASTAAVTAFIQQHDMIVIAEDDIPTHTSNVSFEPFEWLTDEDKDMERATIFLKQQLKKFNISMGRNNFELYDVHASKTILNVDDDKTGKLSGGTDIILAPFGLAVQSTVQEACVCFEFKTYTRIINEGFDKSSAQAILELICSSYHSNQMVMVILTDMHTGAYVYTLSCTPVSNDEEMGGHRNNRIDIKSYLRVSITDMAVLVARHLRDNCTPERTYRYHADKDTQKDSVVLVTEFKRRRVSHTSVALEHFNEMLADTELGSSDRAVVIQQYMGSLGYESNYLSMFV